MTVLIGRTIAGKFAIESLIGQGAMGAVYCARQTALDKIVAIKVMHGDRAREPTLVARFRREARAASRLDHVHSIRVLDFGEEADGLLYIAMEYFPGQPLSAIVSKDCPPRAEVIVDVLSQALSAIASAHALGIVHRDLKPDNILVLDGVDEDGRARLLLKVCDFGIAHVLEGRPASTASPSDRLTTDGIILGTPYYMSPEQTRGHALDTRSDIYSMGVILYELLTGEVPFDGRSVFDVALAHCFQAPVPPCHRMPSADPGLEAICLRAMQKDPAHRYGTAREMRAAVRALTSPSAGESAGETQPAFAPLSAAGSALRVGPPAATTASGAASSRPAASPPPTALPTGAPPDPALLDAASQDAASHAPGTRRLARARLVGIGILVAASAGVIVARRPALTPRLWVSASPTAPVVPTGPTGAKGPTAPAGPSGATEPQVGARAFTRDALLLSASPAAAASSAAANAPPLVGHPHAHHALPARTAEPPDDRAPWHPPPEAHAAEELAPVQAIVPPAVPAAVPAAAEPLTPPAAVSSAPTPVTAPQAAFDPSRARIDWSVVSTGGGATLAAFRHGLAHAASGWTACYRDALSRAGHPSGGPATLRVTTDEEGNVVRAALDGFTLPGLAACLDGATRVHVDGADTGSAWAEVRATFRSDGSE